MKSDSFDASSSGDDVSHLVKNAAIGGISRSVKHVGSEGISVPLHSSASSPEDRDLFLWSESGGGLVIYQTVTC